MKEFKYMDEEELIRKAVDILMRELGPVESARFLNLVSAKHKDTSEQRHRKWQSKLKPDAFFDQIFSPERH